MYKPDLSKVKFYINGKQFPVIDCIINEGIMHITYECLGNHVNASMPINLHQK